MTPHGLPEVIMFGLRAETMQFFINEVCGRMLHEQVRYGHGDVISELSGEGQPMMVLDVEDTSPLGTAHRLYQEVRAIQLVYADPEGRFPWQEGHSFPLDEQPLLGRPGNRSEGSDPPRRPGPTTSAAEAGATPSTGRMNDIIDGGRGADTIEGGAGNDRLLGRKGNDSLADSSGTNTLRGGWGFDTCQGAGNILFNCETVT